MFNRVFNKWGVELVLSFRVWCRILQTTDMSLLLFKQKDVFNKCLFSWIEIVYLSFNGRI